MSCAAARTGSRGSQPTGAWPQPARDAARDRAVAHALTHPAWGHRKVWAMTRHDGHRVSQATVQRLLRDEGLIFPAHYQRDRRRLAERRKAAFAKEPTGPNQVWQLDFSEYETTTGGTWRITSCRDYVRNAHQRAPRAPPRANPGPNAESERLSGTRVGDDENASGCSVRRSTRGSSSSTRSAPTGTTTTTSARTKRSPGTDPPRSTPVSPTPPSPPSKSKKSCCECWSSWSGTGWQGGRRSSHPGRDSKSCWPRAGLPLDLSGRHGPAPAESRRRPPVEQGAAHRDHREDDPRPSNPCLRRTPDSGKAQSTRDSPLPQVLSRASPPPDTHRPARHAAEHLTDIEESNYLARDTSNEIAVGWILQ